MATLLCEEPSLLKPCPIVQMCETDFSEGAVVDFFFFFCGSWILERKVEKKNTRDHKPLISHSVIHQETGRQEMKVKEQSLEKGLRRGGRREASCLSGGWNC